jgi:hypothetical protein
MQACAGPGKSAVLAWCGWWFLSVQGSRGEHPKGIALSITGDNLKANLWAIAPRPGACGGRRWDASARSR